MWENFPPRAWVYIIKYTYGVRFCILKTNICYLQAYKSLLYIESHSRVLCIYSFYIFVLTSPHFRIHFFFYHRIIFFYFHSFFPPLNPYTEYMYVFESYTLMCSDIAEAKIESNWVGAITEEFIVVIYWENNKKINRHSRERKKLCLRKKRRKECRDGNWNLYIKCNSWQ